jgi:hypothetical protein
MFPRILVCLVSAVLVHVAPLRAGGPKVHVVISPDAPRLEQFAAKELAALFQQLFEAEVSITKQTPAAAEHLIFLGSPATNSALQEHAGSTWPKLSDQGHVLRSTGKDGKSALIVGGGSPAATLWAVYELGQRFGMRYLLHGDVPPATPPTLKLTGFDVVLEPSLRLRAWQTIDAGPAGLESWGLADQKKLLGQLAKLKFNRVVLAVHPWQPFAHYEFKGVKKQTGLLWHGRRYPVGGDTAGRGAFKGATLFTNPDFEGKTTYDDMTKAGVTLARGIIDTAHQLGMTAGIAIAPFEFPKEFAAVLPKAFMTPGREKLTIGPEPAVAQDDPALKDLAATQIRAYLDTYPAINSLYLSLPASQASPQWIERHAKAWLDDPKLLKRKDGGKVDLTIAGVDPLLVPEPDGVAPKGAFIQYDTANKDLLRPAKTPSSVVLTLADDQLGILPQLATRRLHPLLQDLPMHRWQGFTTRCYVPGDLHATVHYLARASFDPKLTPQAAYEDLIDPICGEGVSQRLTKGLDMIEKATETIAQNDPNFAFPTPGMMMRHYSAEPLPPWWKTVRDLYAGAMDEVYRANTRARDGVKARPYMVYYAKRLEFAFFYMTSLEAVRLAGQAKAKGDVKTQLEHLQAATEALYDGLSAYSEVARDQSDRGVIAVLNEYGYRPLRKEMDVAKKTAKK